MPENSQGLHEDASALGSGVVNRHRAIASIMEELEAVDWYDQRVAATDDPSLAAVLGHSRDEEKEHAAMTLEWLRRHDPVLDEQLRTYLFTEGSLLEVEHEAESDGEAGGGGAGGGGGGGGGRRSGGGTGLGIGSLREGKELL